MFQKIRIFFRYTFAWILLIGCVGIIGFVLYPLLAEKYASMSLGGSIRRTNGWSITRWYPLEITRNTTQGEKETRIIQTTPRIDTIEENFDANITTRTNAFFSTIKEAFSTNTNKKTATYTKDENGVYQGEERLLQY